jgi:hypothetical protein
MAFNINEMKAALTGGGAKSTLFQVSITNKIDSTADALVPFMVHAAQLPQSSLGSYQLPYMGRKINLAGDRVFEPWTVSVYNDENFAIRNRMEQWMNAINSHTGNLRLTNSSSPSDYKSQALITQFGKTGQALRTYKFEGLFPSTISAIEMDWNGTDSIESYQITFQYDLWTVEGITGDAFTNA